MHHALLYTGRQPEALLQAALVAARTALGDTTKTPQQHPDCHILTADGKDIGIEAVRGWRTAAYLAPNEAPCHVFIMPDADRMTQQAQNALLALLEEPPTPCVFILLCQNEDALLATVRSRLYKQAVSGAASALPRDALDWADAVLQALTRNDEWTLLSTLLSAEKKQRDELKIYFEALLQVTYDGRDRLYHLTNAQFFTIINQINQARAALDSNVGNGHTLAALAAQLALPNAAGGR